MVKCWVMCVEQCHQPHMTGNGIYHVIPHIKMAGGWFIALFYSYYVYDMIWASHNYHHHVIIMDLPIVMGIYLVISSLTG